MMPCRRYGFEQEYTMLAAGTGQVYGWPANGYPLPQVRNQGCLEAGVVVDDRIGGMIRSLRDRLGVSK